MTTSARARGTRLAHRQRGSIDGRILRAAVAAMVIARASDAVGQAHAHGVDTLGTVDFPVSCSAAAQPAFNRAVALLHHMTYPAAQRAFERVAAIDSRCAMAHWGVAMTLFQPLWPTRPTPAALRRGWQEVQRAEALAPPTERERLFVASSAAFFREPESTDYWSRIRRWEQAMRAVHAAFPRDPEAAAFYALAHLAVAPVDTAVTGHSERAASLLVEVYERNPDHPGAMHYLVHANDAPGRERDSLAITRRYETAAPHNAHALHMPTHIYVRLGDWPAVIRGNEKAADAARAQVAGDSGQYVWDEFPHAVEYLVYAELQMGADRAAAAQVRRLRGTARLEPTFKTAFHLASTQARYSLERHAWTEAMALVPRQPPALAWERFPWAEAITWFARGIGGARAGKVATAEAARDRLGQLETAAVKTGEELFTRNVRMLRLGVDAWIAHAKHDTAASVRLMQEAVDLEASTPKHPVTPAPTLPALELLGDLLMEQRRAPEALAAYTRSLERYPQRFNSLVGSARASLASGDTVRARASYEQLLEVAKQGDRSAPLDEARRFISSRR